MSSSDEIDLTREVAAEVAKSLARTGVAALRRLQRRVERDNPDLQLSILPAVGDSEAVVYIDGAFEAEVEVMLGDSPRTWFHDVRRAIKIGRSELERRRLDPSSN